MRRFILLLTALALLILPSCVENNTVGGRPVTPEELESISAQVFGTASESQEPEQTGQTEKIEPNLNTTVYWLKDGTVYHLYADCPHLSGKLSVKETTLRTAEANGLRLCKDCENK